MSLFLLYTAGISVSDELIKEKSICRRCMYNGKLSKQQGRCCAPACTNFHVHCRRMALLSNAGEVETGAWLSYFLEELAQGSV